MDRQKTSTNRFAWLPAQMPGVARLINDKRAELGAQWVDTCWRRGVVDGEPGWFFAAEGPLMVGTLWDDVQVLAIAQARVTRTQALLVIRPMDGAVHGA